MWPARTTRTAIEGKHRAFVGQPEETTRVPDHVDTNHHEGKKQKKKKRKRHASDRCGLLAGCEGCTSRPRDGDDERLDGQKTGDARPTYQGESTQWRLWATRDEKPLQESRRGREAKSALSPGKGDGGEGVQEGGGWVSRKNGKRRPRIGCRATRKWAPCRQVGG